MVAAMNAKAIHKSDGMFFGVPLSLVKTDEFWHRVPLWWIRHFRNHHGIQGAQVNVRSTREEGFLGLD